MTGPENPQSTFAATLVDEWVRQGMTDIVIAPGSRSTPLAVAAAEDGRLRVHVHHDERSAAFCALGLGLATGRAAAVLTTSGTAAVELHPAVVEAHEAMVPLLAVTADRPPELRGLMAPQTIDQRDLFGRSVRWYCEFGPPDPAGRGSWRHLAADALAATRGRPPGPVQLNLSFAEPLLGAVGELPPIDGSTARPAAPVWGLLDEQVARLLPELRGRRGVIVAGVRAALDDADRDAVLGLAEALGWPVIADGSSGCRVPRPGVVTATDGVLRIAPVAAELSPEVVIRIGGLLSSRITNEWLAASPARHVGLDRWGRCPDPDRNLGVTLEADVAAACSTLAALIDPATHRAPGGWLDRWTAVERAATWAIAAVLADDPLSEPAVAAAVLAATPATGSLVVSSSMPVRDLEWYAPARDGARVVANRGANGIDGVVSTALGVALGGRPTTLLIGDVAYLHDSNGLIGLAGRGVDLCVVVVDNDGGGIFSFLPQAAALAPSRFEQLFGTPHGIDPVALTRAYGVDATAVTTRSALDDALAAWAVTGGARVLVVRSDRAANAAVHRRLNAAVADALGTLRDG